MIHNFKKWKLIESFGNGEELFSVNVDDSRDRKNIYVKKPLGWDDIEDVTGKLVYRANMSVDREGIESINFSVVELAINLSYTTDDGENWKDIDLVFKEADMKNDIKIEVKNLPFYVDQIDVDLVDCEDEDGELDPTRATIEISIGFDKE